MAYRHPDKPVFVIGVPRSGTTILFEAIARHPALGWPSNYSETLPGWPAANFARRLLDNRLIHAYGRKKQYGRVAVFNRLLPTPHEAYKFWNYWSRAPFATNALPGETVDTQTAKSIQKATSALLRWQGRSRFAAKLTGPARIGFLDSVFPDAKFVHLIRDGRAVVHSLLRVNFWKEQGGLEHPFWDDLLTPADLEKWVESGRDPGILAALQWRRIIQSARAEASRLCKDRYTEYTYENLVDNPLAVVDDVLRNVGLVSHDTVADSINSGPTMKNMNDKYRRDFDPAYIERLSSVMEPVLSELGYR